MKKSFSLQLHRTLNYLGVILMLAALLCVLASRNWTWSGPGATYKQETDNSTVSIHSLFGAIGIAICWIQPFAAFFRCSTTSSKRPIYNWFHRIAGILAWFFAGKIVSGMLIMHKDVKQCFLLRQRLAQNLGLSIQ